jgi:thiamine biosynthesis lipoprotein
MALVDPCWTDRTFRVMGTRARILVVGGPDDLAARGEALTRQLEARWTRFDPASELMQLNAAAGRPVRVSEPTFALVARAVDAWERTAGLFDPTGLDALTEAGYDRDFARLAPAPVAPPDATPGDRPDDDRDDDTAGGVRPPRPLRGCRGIVLDPLVAAVTLPAGVHLDLGGIGKGYAADRVVADLVEGGAVAACVDLGGDVRVAGTGPYSGAWSVGFRDDEPARRFGTVRLAAGAVATSTTRHRRWTRDGVVRHHLIDPLTGHPSRSGVASVTVVAADAWWAEVLAKAALLAGPTAGPALLAAEGVDGVLVTDDGGIRPTPGFAQWCSGPERGVRRDGAPAEPVRTGAGTRSS